MVRAPPAVRIEDRSLCAKRPWTAAVPNA
ncbi:hypothetical protein H4V95_000333 [Arthrobacter sp. CAN_C5]|nr:hypothetical protein [Arthrobacter sp. CAN_C5]MBP2215142.1 hypothetical protein [Arthrobacter sp. CAN_C5]